MAAVGAVVVGLIVPAMGVAAVLVVIRLGSSTIIIPSEPLVVGLADYSKSTQSVAFRTKETSMCTLR